MNQHRRIEKALALVRELPAAVAARAPARMRPAEADAVTQHLNQAAHHLKMAELHYANAEARSPKAW